MNISKIKSRVKNALRLFSVVRRLWRSVVVQNVCNHRFDMNDLEYTNIPEPERPKDNFDYRAWEKYFSDFYKSDFVNKRVKWPCVKCKKVFYAHCGLDILEHGEPVRTP